MMNKKLLCWEKWFLICSILFSLAVVLPLFALAKYAAPWYDDYDAALYTHSFLNLDDHFLLSNLIKGLSFPLPYTGLSLVLLHVHGRLCSQLFRNGKSGSGQNDQSHEAVAYFTQRSLLCVLGVYLDRQYFLFVL